MLTLLASAVNATDIKPNLDFGKPTSEELNMTTYDADTSAAAVMLCNVEDASFYILRKVTTWTSRIITANTANVIWERKIKKRIKILKNEGKTYGDVTIDCNFKDDVVKSIKAASWKIVDGKVIKTSLDSKNIHEETTDDSKKCYKFTIPMVDVGAVIEYEYDIISKNRFHNGTTWYANGPIPVVYAKYKLEVDDKFTIIPMATGLYPLECKKATGRIRERTSNIWTYEGQNIPAIKEREYCWYPTQYNSQVHILNMDGDSWRANEERFYGDKSEFGNLLHRKNPFSTEMKAMGILEMKSRKQQIEACANILFSKLKWNKIYALNGSSESDLLSSGTGTNADLNFIMISMLNELGIKAVPVLLLLRQNGRMATSVFPYPNCVDTFVVGIADDDGNMCYFDGSARYGYLNALPPELLVAGYMLSNNGVNEMTNIVDVAESGCNVAVEEWLDSNDNGRVKSKVDLKYKYNGLLSMSKKEHYNSFNGNDNAYISAQGKVLDAEISNYSNEEAHSFSPKFVEKFSIDSKEIPSSNIEGGELCTINPLMYVPDIMPQLKEAERNIPLDFDSRISLSYNFILHIPQGYDVLELPQNANYRTNDNSAMLKLMSAVTDGHVVLKLNFSIKKNFFLLDEYNELKEISDIFNKLYRQNGCHIKLTKSKSISK